MPQDRKKRKIRNALKIAEISGVDVPAQEGAKALIMKRHEAPRHEAPRHEAPRNEDVVAKSAALTSPHDGHTHLLYTGGIDGDWTSGKTTWDADHDHPWVRDATGAIEIGEGGSDGHTHVVAAVTKAVENTEAAGETGENVVKKEADMPDDNTTATPTVEQLQKQLDRANKVAGLSDSEKAYFKGLGEPKQDAFLAKSDGERASEVEAFEKNAQDADPVVYTTTAGLELRKSAGEALIAMAKSNDAIASENAELRKAAADADIRKRAETELAHLPGDLNVRVALLKSVEAIKDETERGAALNALKAQNTALSGAFVEKGHKGGSTEQASAEDKLNELAKARSESEKVTFAKAYSDVLGTSEGQALYNQTLN